MNSLIQILVAVAVLASGCAEGSRPANMAATPSDQALLLHNQHGAIVQIQVHAARGYLPSAIALDGLNQTIREVSGKETHWGGIFSLNNSVETNDKQDINRIARQVRGNLTDSMPTIRLIYMSGQSEDDSVAFYAGNLVIFVFLDTLDSDLLVGLQLRGLGVNELRPYAERSVLVHEFGHALGLVNCGLPMLESREDRANPCHSLQQNSVMQHQVSYVSGNPAQVAEFGVEPIWRFNDADLQDIRSFRESPAQQPN